MSFEPPNYGAASINKLEMPQIEQVDDRWRSVWMLQLSVAAGPVGLDSVADAVSSECPAHIQLGSEGGCVVMVMESEDHPLDVEAFTTVDCVLRAVDAALEIETINGSPRDMWRTFRQRV